MKKLFIITGVIAFFGISNISYSNDNPSNDPYAVEQWIHQIQLDPDDLKQINDELEQIDTSDPILKLMHQQLQVKKKQLEQEKKVHISITGNRTKSKPKQYDAPSLLLEPNYIYDKNNHNKVIRHNSLNAKDIEQEENINRFTSLQGIRTFIKQRIKHATAIDKAVSLQAFTEAENRFEAIADILIALDKISDLKGLAEIQARMKIMLAMIQNEATKLQMVAHFRRAEQALINQQKRALYLHVFQKDFTKMPAIKINANSP